MEDIEILKGCTINDMGGREINCFNIFFFWRRSLTRDLQFIHVDECILLEFKSNNPFS